MFSSYLQHRNGHYHLRVRTPVELQGIIPQPEIIKTIRTTSLRYCLQRYHRLSIKVKDSKPIKTF